MKPTLICFLLTLVFCADSAIAAGQSTLAVALEKLSDALSEGPSSAEQWTDYGNLLVVARRFDEAQEAYETALAMDTESAMTHYNLGLLELEFGRHRKAADHFRHALDQDPAFARAHYALGSALAGRNRHRRAVEHFSRAFQLDSGLMEPSNNPEVLFNELATWASMHGYLSLAPGRATRLYNDPSPIVGLMVPDLEAVLEPDETPPAPDEVE